MPLRMRSTLGEKVFDVCNIILLILLYWSVVAQTGVFATFVAVDQSGSPIPVTEIIPETDREKELYEQALQRRELRMLLAGRIKPEDAKELKELLG